MLALLRASLSRRAAVPRRLLQRSRPVVLFCSASVGDAAAEVAGPPSKSKGSKGEPGKGKGKGGAPASTSSAEDIRALRLAKCAELRAAGTEPYAYSFERTALAAALQATHTGLAAGAEAEGPPVAVAGRVVARRSFGKLAFLSLADESGTIQLYCELSRLGDAGFAALAASLDVGDIVGAVGPCRRTEKGELSVAPTAVTLLTKALRPLPDKWHGLVDAEKRARQRHLDLLSRPEARDALRKRALVVSRLRRSLEGRGFMEAETPVLQAEAGGADARPFATYHNALARPLTLRIATELHLKRLVVGGFERVFELGRVFRNEGISTRHNPEFTSVELYQAFADRGDMLDLAEALVADAAVAVTGGTEVVYQGTPLSLAPPFRRVSMNQLVLDALGVDVLALREGPLGEAQAVVQAALAASSLPGARAAAAAARGAPTVGHLLNTLFDELCESELIQPTFVLDQPLEVSPLAKQHRSQPGVAERFELYIYGRELANAYSELTDPAEQRARFQAQISSHAQARQAAEARVAAEGSEAAAEAAGELAYDIELDEDFLEALEVGMPPTGGMGIGVDRLVMLLTDSASIKDVIAFPLLREEKAQQTGSTLS